MVERLGPALATRKLHFFFLLDASGSMADDGKIGALNDAMRAALAAVEDAENSNPGVEVLVRAIAFAEYAWWHVPEPTAVGDVNWADLVVMPQGVTETGLAIDLVNQELRALGTHERALPPAIILVSDGRPTTHRQPDYDTALAVLLSEFWGSKASRLAIGIGADADAASLERFIANPSVPVVRAANAAELAQYLKWASTVAVDSSSRLARPAERPADALTPHDLARLPPPTGAMPSPPQPPAAADPWAAPTVMGDSAVPVPALSVAPPPPPVATDDDLTW